MDPALGNRFERGQQIFYVLEVGHEFKIIPGVVRSCKLVRANFDGEHNWYSRWFGQSLIWKISAVVKPTYCNRLIKVTQLDNQVLFATRDEAKLEAKRQYDRAINDLHNSIYSYQKENQLLLVGVSRIQGKTAP